ncbi:uncharacterized protein MAM_02500 [Metarhizium album ARSEF 1941]|uniref:Uncharacterized protein n=1 Tax=Metarhizium album (strain ARSEF 1941) TaxID=1081103 RepID=A0A0B2X1S5_METAS|nr:uncharacterized protein MAM_02500 [Metarhizium album ARSEF 1941]KHN99647.1 hypothetical protein MAM_02500 [Metarhizium album ARSEF 1941]
MTQESQESPGTQLHDELAEPPEIDGPLAGTPEISPETPKRGPVTTNPFYLADRLPKTPLSAPQIAKSSARAARRPRRPSDCVPRRFRNRSPSGFIEEVSPRQRGVENNHGPDIEAHSLCCSAPITATDIQKDRRGADLSVNLESKVSELFRHVEDLHKAQYLRKYLATAIDELDCGSDVSISPRSKFPGDQPGMETPTSQLRKSRLHNLSEDPKHSVGIVCEAQAHHIEQDVVAGSLGPEGIQNTGYIDHPIYTIPSSGKAGSNTSLSGTEKTKCGEARPHLEPSFDKHHSSGEDSDGSPQSTRRFSGGREPDENVGSAGADVLHPNETDPRGSDTLPGDQPAANRVMPDLPSTTGYKRHRQNTQLCPRPQTPSTGPDPWPILKRVGQPSRQKLCLTPNSVPWARPTLRKVPATPGAIRSRSNCSTPSEWKRNPRKTDEAAHASPSKTIPVGTPVSEWRGSLTKTERITPRTSHRSTLCESCNPAESKPSTVNSGTSGRCSHRDSHSGHTNKSNSNVEDPFTEPRLSVRAVEHSLAWKKVQEDIERRVYQDADEAPVSFEGASVSVEREQETESIRRAPPESTHICNPRSRDTTERDEMVSSETMPGQAGPSNESAEEAPTGVEANTADELGIEGLTIVVHLRHRDDLVISTDLNGREYKGK